MCAVRLKHLLWFDSTNPRTLLLPYRAAWLALAAALFGGALIWRRDPPHSAAAPLAMVLALAFAHVLVTMSARFRLPLEAAFMLPAGLILATVARMVFPLEKKKSGV
jgi:hypothetical protein